MAYFYKSIIKTGVFKKNIPDLKFVIEGLKDSFLVVRLIKQLRRGQV